MVYCEFWKCDTLSRQSQQKRLWHRGVELCAWQKRPWEARCIDDVGKLKHETTGKVNIGLEQQKDLATCLADKHKSFIKEYYGDFGGRRPDYFVHVQL